MKMYQVVRNRGLLFLTIITALGTGNLQADEVTLRGGDVVQLKLMGVPEKDQASISGEYTVTGEGTVRLPYLEKEIPAAGKRPSVLARSVETRYVEAGIFTDPRVLVAIDQQRPTRFVSVAGEVRSPGDVAYRHDLTLMSALSSRGGFSDFANVRKVQLIRDGKTSTHDLKRISVEPEVDVKVKPGDRILVPQAGLFRK